MSSLPVHWQEARKEQVQMYEFSIQNPSGQELRPKFQIVRLSDAHIGEYITADLVNAKIPEQSLVHKRSLSTLAKEKTALGVIPAQSSATYTLSLQMSKTIPDELQDMQLTFDLDFTSDQQLDQSVATQPITVVIQNVLATQSAVTSATTTIPTPLALPKRLRKTAIATQRPQVLGAASVSAEIIPNQTAIVPLPTLNPTLSSAAQSFPNISISFTHVVFFCMFGLNILQIWMSHRRFTSPQKEILN